MPLAACMFQSISRKRRLRPSFFLYISLLAIFIYAGYFSYTHWDELYFRFLEGAYARLEKKSMDLETNILDAYHDGVFSDSIAGSAGLTQETKAKALRLRLASQAKLLKQIQTSQRLAQIISSKRSVDAMTYYYQGLFAFYELLVRLGFNFTQRSLLELSGRSLLPEEHITWKAFLVSEPSTALLARRIAVRMHQAIALEADFLRQDSAQVILAYASLLDFGYMNRMSYTRLDALDAKSFSPLFQVCLDWLRLAFYVHLGEYTRLSAVLSKGLLAATLVTQEGPVNSNALSQNSDSPLLVLRPGFLRLLRNYALFYSKNYTQALKGFRALLRETNLSTELHLESLRMEAEAIYMQRGSEPAKVYFKRVLDLASQRARVGAALSLSKADYNYIRERWNELYL